MVDKTREIALKILYKIDKEKAYSNLVLDEMLKQNKNKIDERDIGLISEIVYGVTTWRLTIDEIIKKYSNIRLKKISTWILNILRIGIYQIVFLDKIPKSAAVNESVNLAKKYGHKSSSNFVNAILRKVETSDYEEFFNIEDDKERISKTTSMPLWIVEKLLQEKDMQEVESICKNSNIKPQMHIRINNLKTNKKEMEKQLQDRNIQFKQGILKDFLILEKVKNIENLDLFKQGYFTIQDEGAGIIPLVLAPNKGEIILDACSSPGGKTTYMAELIENEGEILAWDIHEHRTKLVQNATQRLGIEIVKTQVQDATIYNEEYKEKFDKILLDVPCLGLGVLKRKPDIKWQREEKDVKEITKIQKNILENCSRYLKKNGVLVYSTCSILKEENECVIEEFLKKNKDFILENIKINKEKINEIEFQKYIQKQGYMNILQSKLSDGFFIAKLKKIN